MMASTRIVRTAFIAASFIIASTSLVIPGCGGGGGSSSDEGDSSPGSSDSSSSGDAPTAALTVGVYDSMVVEGADDLEFIVSLSSASQDVVTVEFETIDSTARAGSDYQAASGAVVFQPGEVRKPVVVSILLNASGQSGTSKNLRLELNNPENSRISRAEATGTIIDSDSVAADTAYNPGWSPVGVFSGANACDDCHASNGSIMQYSNPDVTLSTDDVSPSTQWRHSVMAHAANDPYWHAAVEDESETFPHLAGLIEDTCTTCHTPMGRTHAYQTNTDLDSDGYYRFDTAMGQDHAREGVSCTFCHQVEDSNMGMASSFSGGFIVADAPGDDKPLFGPYANPIRQAMRNRTIYDPAQGLHLSSSEHCATCHTLYTPAIDAETGAPSGVSFLEQGPYLEWQNSVYATGQTQEQQCQDCHMPEPAPGYSTAITTTPFMASDRTPFGQHTLVGGNTHLLEILKTYRAELGISASTTVDGFNDEIAHTRNLLENSAADVAISSPSVSADSLEFGVVVTNNAGHKIPSAYPSRRAWFHVTVKNGSGVTIFESGKPDSRGYISTDVARLKADCMSTEKLDGFDNAVCYEPHRDVISSPGQVAIYETVLGDIHGVITHTLLKAGQYLKDNRIPPDGFTNSAASTIEPQTIPVGVAGDGDFNCVATTEGCGTDTVHYRVDLAGQSGPYSVEAKLLYQSTQPAFVDGLHVDGDRVNRFKVMYDAVPPTVELLGGDTVSGIN